MVVFLQLDGLDVGFEIIEGSREIGGFKHHIVFAVVVTEHQNFDCEMDSVKDLIF